MNFYREREREIIYVDLRHLVTNASFCMRCCTLNECPIESILELLFRPHSGDVRTL